MIRFEQDPRGAIEEIIRDDVRIDMYEELYGIEQATDAIMVYVEQLQGEIELFKAKWETAVQAADHLRDEIDRVREHYKNNYSWNGSVDRQGGSFTDQEIKDSTTWR